MNSSWFESSLLLLLNGLFDGNLFDLSCTVLGWADPRVCGNRGMCVGNVAFVLECLLFPVGDRMCGSLGGRGGEVSSTAAASGVAGRW